MNSPYVLYGWHLSYFTGKALSYLRYKQVDFEFNEVDFYTLMVKIKQETGAAVMPVLKSPDGQWIQDTSVIIDHIESLFAQRPVLPQTPVQRFASMLLEAWGDEWWIPVAMHTRWSYPENYALFEAEAGQALLPWAPAFLQRWVARKPATMLRGMLPFVGIVPEQFPTLNAWSISMLNALDAHFQQHPFLLGNRPTLGDFSLVGTMYGHLGRDPWPKRQLVEPRKHLKAWLDRMTQPAGYAQGDLFADDAIPETLAPVFASLFTEFMPMVAGIAEQVNEFSQTHPDWTHKLPRKLKAVQTTMGGRPFQRAALPYTLWMVQRAFDCFAQMNEDEQAAVRRWLATFNAEHVLSMPVPRVRRVALNVALEKTGDKTQ